jgi:hypothetical protein
MTYFATTIAVTVDLLILVVLVGLYVRRRLSVCYAFTAQQAFILATDLLMIFGYFYEKKYWVVFQSLSHLLTFLVALEITYKTFRAFPGARATARGVLIAVLCVTFFAALSASLGATSPSAEHDPELQTLPRLGAILLLILPRLLNGAIWLFTAVAGLILWYRLPVDAFLKAILVAYVPYMLIYMLALNAVEAYGLKVVEQYLRYSDPIAYMMVIAYWGYAAWRPFRAPVRPASPAAAPVRHPA